VIGCPQIVSYTEADWDRIERAVKKLQEDNPLIPVLHNYLILREKAKACHKIKRNGLATR
jgi:hypothetical protein